LVVAAEEKLEACQDGQRHPRGHILSNQILDEAYERLHVTGPEFGGDEEGSSGLSNHGPMAAEVLVRRGHEFDVPQWLDAYVPRLEKLPRASDRITSDNWRDALGSGRRAGDWTAFFTSRVSEHPWRGVLATWWPRLLPGIAAGATHGVSRAGHAVRTLHAGDDSPAAVTELGHGLAYWAGRWRAVPGVAAPAGRLDAAAALETVPRLPVQRGVIASRIPKLANLRREDGRPPAGHRTWWSLVGAPSRSACTVAGCRSRRCAPRAGRSARYEKGRLARPGFRRPAAGRA